MALDPSQLRWPYIQYRTVDFDSHEALDVLELVVPDRFSLDA